MNFSPKRPRRLQISDYKLWCLYISLQKEFLKKNHSVKSYKASKLYICNNFQSNIHSYSFIQCHLKCVNAILRCLITFHWMGFLEKFFLQWTIQTSKFIIRNLDLSRSLGRKVHFFTSLGITLIFRVSSSFVEIQTTLLNRFPENLERCYSCKY